MADMKFTTQKHREWVKVVLTEIKGNLSHVKEKVDEQENHLSKLNDRVRKNETKISAITGIGSVLALGFTTVFGYFFNKN